MDFRRARTAAPESLLGLIRPQRRLAKGPLDTQAHSDVATHRTLAVDGVVGEVFFRQIVLVVTRLGSGRKIGPARGKTAIDSGISEVNTFYG